MSAPFPGTVAPMLYSGSLTRSILEVKNLSKTYESGFKALKGVNL